MSTEICEVEDNVVVDTEKNTQKRSETSEWVLNAPDPPTPWHQLVVYVRKTISYYKQRCCSLRGQPAPKVVLSFFSAIFPILDWIQNYTLTKFRNDLLAGLTLASLCIPQSIGYATLAKLDPEYGLYTSVVPPLLYAVMGTSREIAIGPVAVVSLLLSSMIQNLIAPATDPVGYRKLACFLCHSLCWLGFLVDFLSHAAIVGFMAGAAIIIGLQQLKGLLGIDHFTNKTDIISVMSSVWESFHHPGKRNRKLFWLPAISPLISVILATLIVFLTKADKSGVNIVKHIKGGLNPISIIEIELNSPHVGALAKIGLLVAVVALTESVAVGRSFASMKGYHLDGNKEMMSLGFMNIIGCFTSCYVATAFFGVMFGSVEIGLLVAVTISFMKIILMSIGSGIDILGRLPGTDMFSDVHQYHMAMKTLRVMIIRIQSSLLCFSNANAIVERETACHSSLKGEAGTNSILASQAALQQRLDEVAKNCEVNEPITDSITGDKENEIGHALEAAAQLCYNGDAPTCSYTSPNAATVEYVGKERSLASKKQWKKLARQKVVGAGIHDMMTGSKRKIVADMVMLEAEQEVHLVHDDAKRAKIETNKEYHATFLYGFPSAHEKRRTWDLVRLLKGNAEVPWVLMGDFNQILGPEDKVGGAGIDFQGVQVAQTCLQECELHEIPFIGNRFTWCNRQKHPNTIEERLDRACANQQWRDLWRFSIINSLPRYRSDHNPIMLEASMTSGGAKKKKKRYRFEQVWIYDDELDQDKWCPILSDGMLHSGSCDPNGIQLVSDLIWPHSRTWNTDLLHILFSPFEAAIIAQIPLSLRRNKDVQVWRLTENGVYSVKSGYWQIIKGMKLGETSDNSRDKSTLWRKIWKVQTIPRCKELARRACKNIIPIRMRLLSKGVEVDSRCPLCGEEDETVIHAFLTCQQVSPIWFASPLTVRIDTSSNQSFDLWLSEILEKSGTMGGPMILELLYAIWCARNDWCFNGKRTPVMQILCKAASYMLLPPLVVPINEASAAVPKPSVTP
ncbi:hypothetical protein RIF29_11279 [Crotalaria pallida]|uniref:Uncharacterized protein n=1 Tax=Crotalaria pallida TaxID=3830 RepID=A0AAN9NZZ4_CROPI